MVPCGMAIHHTARYMVVKHDRPLNYHTSYTRALQARQYAGKGAAIVDRAGGRQKITGNPTGILAAIRAGDRVTIMTPHKQKHTGRAVMRGPYGWVLNMGGRHGIPAVATEANIVGVKPSRARKNPLSTTSSPRSSDRSRQFGDGLVVRVGDQVKYEGEMGGSGSGTVSGFTKRLVLVTDARGVEHEIAGGRIRRPKRNPIIALHGVEPIRTRVRHLMGTDEVIALQQDVARYLDEYKIMKPRKGMFKIRSMASRSPFLELHDADDIIMADLYRRDYPNADHNELSRAYSNLAKIAKRHGYKMSGSWDQAMLSFYPA